VRGGLRGGPLNFRGSPPRPAGLEKKKKKKRKRKKEKGKRKTKCNLILKSHFSLLSSLHFSVFNSSPSVFSERRPATELPTPRRPCGHAQLPTPHPMTPTSSCPRSPATTHKVANCWVPLSPLTNTERVLGIWWIPLPKSEFHYLFSIDLGFHFKKKKKLI
jgi:hypothetical protein